MGYCDLLFPRLCYHVPAAGSMLKNGLNCLSWTSFISEIYIKLSKISKIVSRLATDSIVVFGTMD